MLNDIDSDVRDYEDYLQKWSDRILEQAEIAADGATDYMEELFTGAATLRYMFLINGTLADKIHRADTSAPACVALVIQKVPANIRTIMSSHSLKVTQAIKYVTDDEVGMNAYEVPTRRQLLDFVHNHPSGSDKKHGRTVGSISSLSLLWRGLYGIRKTTALLALQKNTAQQRIDDIKNKKLAFENIYFREGKKEEEIAALWELHEKKSNDEQLAKEQEAVNKLIKIENYYHDEDGNVIACVKLEQLKYLTNQISIKKK
jgi:hypothetical protein